MRLYIARRWTIAVKQLAAIRESAGTVGTSIFSVVSSSTSINTTLYVEIQNWLIRKSAQFRIIICLANHGPLLGIRPLPRSATRRTTAS
ncbi:hypothetical protein JYU34_020233 [Plutella xylostella]|uniref:Uncharacterized protein n=1 Tax=Plutella xylostella TaxID=51655 RepID=A0ABQ7PU53_PLUXY|nr:hypothetical protein JYU34_020233 [Plutella xylostella]